MIHEVDRLLILLHSPPDSSDDRIATLAQILDALAHIYHSLPEDCSEATAEPQEITPYRDMYKIVTEAFPQFGFYPVTDPKAAFDSERTLADAIDDLVDIALEMEEVKWRYDNNGPQDAAWLFRFGFRSHWGRHLHNLRSYCHSLQFGN